VSTELDDLVARFEALLIEARAAGLGDELAPILRRMSAGVSGHKPLDQEVPMRFGMVGDSPAMQELYGMLERVAPSDVAVLVHGETGTGKELVAKALHEYGARKGKPFMAENCAAVPANLLESELFGHKKGAFTGAIADRPGHFVAADGGTVFLDEIGDMPMEMQAKLLRVLQDGEVRPVGSNKSRRVDVRVVAASNKDLPDLCKRGEFRQDLYFRLAVITLELPPLRDRDGDIAHLASFFLERFVKSMGREARFTPAAMQALAVHPWPGNVRELENEVQRALALSSGDIDVGDLSGTVTGRG
jgi:two-component system, NtrC family, response regulator HydG